MTYLQQIIADRVRTKFVEFWNANHEVAEKIFRAYPTENGAPVSALHLLNRIAGAPLEQPADEAARRLAPGLVPITVEYLNDLLRANPPQEDGSDGAIIMERSLVAGLAELIQRCMRCIEEQSAAVDQLKTRMIVPNLESAIVRDTIYVNHLRREVPHG